jgi:hypothetical protein
MLNAHSYLKQNSSNKTVYEAKRKRLAEIVKAPDEIEDGDTDSELSLYIMSSDGTKKYSVNIGYKDDNVHFECSCGDQFGLKQKRNCCRHIGSAIMKINKSFMDNLLKTDKPQVVNTDVIVQIVSLLEKFEI